MGIKPLGDRVIVKNIHNYEDNDESDLLIGEIIDMQEILSDDMNVIWYEINIGDKIIFKRGSGAYFADRCILKSQEVLGIIEDKENE